MKLLEIKPVGLVLVVGRRSLVVPVDIEVLVDGSILLRLHLLLQDDILDLLRQSWEVVQVDLVDLLIGV